MGIGRTRTYLVELGEGVLCVLVGRPAPVVEHGAVRAGTVHERRPLPRPNTTHAQLGLGLLVALVDCRDGGHGASEVCNARCVVDIVHTEVNCQIYVVRITGT